MDCNETMTDFDASAYHLIACGDMMCLSLRHAMSTTTTHNPPTAVDTMDNSKIAAADVAVAVADVVLTPIL